MNRITSLILLATCFTSLEVVGQSKNQNSTSNALEDVSLSGLKFRSIGPGITGGRIVDLAVNPFNHSEYYVASGSGSLWKTSNNGVTFSPVFEGQSTFAMGCVTIDPVNPNVVWVGTGESNAQSNAIYGDGVYRSDDGGKSWENMGLTKSEHIGDIVVDPTNTDIVYVAAYGSAHNEGGDRGIYKTINGGLSWERVLNLGPYVGCFEVHMDPRYPSILYASAQQRLSKGNVSVRGGVEGGIFKSTDGGESWDKVSSPIPEATGRIGLAISPANPDYVYALVEAKENGGCYRSTDRGASWTKQSSYSPAYPFYMQKLVADPLDENKIYSMDLLNQVSKDGGVTFSKLGEKYKHVDNHAMWIDPTNTKHLISGNDGGVYDSWDEGKNWDFKANMAITEIYKISTDNSTPFYNVFIGTQDNSSLIGPSRTLNSSGITNREWSYTLGGDGFMTQADWKDPNILYVQSQNGNLVRFDKKSGEQLFIQPINTKYDSGYRFDWDSPLRISRFDNNMIYFAAHKVFRSNDQGSTWKEISPDLTRGVPQKMDRIMGKSWSIDEMAGKRSSAKITALAESPLDEQIIYAGTGDGLIHVTKNGGETWEKASVTPGILNFTRVHQIFASHHDKNVAFAACQAVKSGDQKPHVLMTTDGGRTWSSINGNLPAQGSTYSIVEDHKTPNLLFVGTQFGLYASNDRGKTWVKFMNGLPTVTYQSLSIQEREDDLVAGTYGRGIYILDDYSPLRSISTDLLKQDAFIFPIKDACMYVEAHPFGYPGIGFQGGSFFSAPNPKVGATITYYVKEEIKTAKEKRRKLEKDRQEKGLDLAYPTYKQLLKESQQPDPYLLFTISDANGNVVRKIKTGVSTGVNRITWDFRRDPIDPISFTPFDDTYAWVSPSVGYMVPPGTYNVALDKFEDGQYINLVSKKEFNCVYLNHTSIPAADKVALDAFNKKVAELGRAAGSADEYMKWLKEKVKYYKKAYLETPGAPVKDYEKILALETQLDGLSRKLNGDGLRRRYEGATPTSLKDRIDIIVYSLWTTTAAPTETFKSSYKIVAEAFENVLTELKAADEQSLELDKLLESYGASYTPGRFPEWKKE